MSRTSLFGTTCLAASVVFTGCSQSPQSPSPAGSGPGVVVLSASPADGSSGSQSVTLDRIRVSQGTRAFYAIQGGSYTATTESAVEIWVEGSVSTGVPPRLVINWGDGVADNIGCGSCKLSHIYSTAAARVVTVTLDDRVSVVEKWTFTLNVVPAGPDPLRIIFNSPMPDFGAVGSLLVFNAEAFYTKDVPVSISCSIVCVTAIACNIALPSVNSTGRASSTANVVASLAVTVEHRCTATAEDLTVSAVRQVSWQ